MTDIATLGLAIDSRQATTAKTALDALAASAKPAAAGITALERAAASAQLTIGPKLAKDIERAGISIEEYARRVNLGGKESELAGKRHGAAAGSLSQLSFQINDIASGLAMGQSPFQIMAQQGGQVFQVWQMNNNIFREAGSFIARLLTPMRALALGAAAVGIAAIAMNMSWKSSEKQFDDTSRAIGTTIGQLHALETAASFKGIETDDFLKASEKFAQGVYQARSGAGGLAEVFRANGHSAQTFTEHLEKAADLIRNASSDQQRLVLLQQMGLPATMEWVKFLSQGKEGIRQALLEAQRFDSTANGTLIAKARQFDEEWNRAWKNFSNYARIATIETKGFLDDLSLFGNRVLSKLGVDVGRNLMRAGQGVPLQQDFSDFYKSVGILDPKQKATVDKDVLQRSISLEQQRISILGQSASVQEQVRAVEMQIQQARLNGIRITGDEAANLKRLAEEQALGVTQIRAQADAYTLEAETVGMSTGQAASYLAIHQRIVEAKREGRTLTQDNISAIRAEGNVLGEAAQRAEDMRWGYENLVRGPLQAFRQELSRGASFFEALQASGLRALDAIGAKLMDMAAQNLWAAAFGGNKSGGGLLGLLGLGGGGMPVAGPDAVNQFAAAFPAPIMHSGHGPGDRITRTRLVDPAVFLNAPRFHTGIGPGERAAIIRNDESVLTPGQMKAAGGGSTTIQITQHNSFTNADPNSEAKMRQWSKQTADMAVQESLQQIAKVSGNTPSYRRGITG